MLLTIGCISSYPQEHYSENDLIVDVLSSIDSIANYKDNIESINEGDPDSDFVIIYYGTKTEGEEEILNMVKTFYAPEDKPDKTGDVLGFLTHAYSEHDFLESGSWVEEDTNRAVRYIPYAGVLPEYTYKDFIRPVAGIITSGYGYRENRHRRHYGIDLSAHKGDSVRCALPGAVTRIGYEKGGYGHYVVVAHSGDIETIYAHLQKPVAVIGQSVSSGDIIGLAGSTGNSTGPHLHFETRHKGLPVNPLIWFNITGYEP